MDAAQTYSLTSDLVEVAMGRKPADLVVRSGKWVCVQSGEIVPKTDIAICKERIAYVGPDALHTIGSHTRVIEAEGRYLSPGLLDGHMHVESSMLTVTEFVRAVLPFGTTGIFIDPHEIANVFGLKGVRLMVDEAAVQPIHVWIQAPSCVPSAPGMETPGASLEPADIAQALQWKGVIGLGEVMNFPGVIAGNEKMHLEIMEARLAGKIIGGHYASPDLGIAFHAYAAGGAQDDHEGTRMEDAAARVRQGMRAMLRFGSGWRDIAEGVRAITEMGLEARHFILCTDDSHSETLSSEGHMNRALKQAIGHGIPPITAIQMATLNTAEHFGVSRDVGMIAPGRYADIVLSCSLTDWKAEWVIAKGRPVAQAGQVSIEMPAFQIPDWARQSIRLGKTMQVSDFRLPAPDSANATANVIGVIEGQAPTRHLRLQVDVHNGEVLADLRNDLAKIALIERHRGEGKVQIGLVQGFGLRIPCAIASTVAHDSHQMLVLGTQEEDMALAANELARIGGGQIVVRGGKIIGQVSLPIAGLMSDTRADLVARQAASVLQGFRECGCPLHNPNMQLSLLALVVIPELRISDLGLVDVNQFKFIPVLENAK